MPKVVKPYWETAPEEIAKSIKKAMIDRNYNQKSFAKKLGVDRSTISRRLDNMNSVSLGELIRMASALGLTIKIE